MTKSLYFVSRSIYYLFYFKYISKALNINLMFLEITFNLKFVIILHKRSITPLIIEPFKYIPDTGNPSGPVRRPYFSEIFPKLRMSYVTCQMHREPLSCSQDLILM